MKTSGRPGSRGKLDSIQGYRKQSLPHAKHCKQQPDGPQSKHQFQLKVLLSSAHLGKSALLKNSLHIKKCIVELRGRSSLCQLSAQVTKLMPLIASGSLGMLVDGRDLSS